MSRLETSSLFTAEVALGPVVEVGRTPTGFRRVIPIVGGTVSGGLEGQVLPGGADWNVLRLTDHGRGGRVVLAQ